MPCIFLMNVNCSRLRDWMEARKYLSHVNSVLKCPIYNCKETTDSSNFIAILSKITSTSSDKTPSPSVKECRDQWLPAPSGIIVHIGHSCYCQRWPTELSTWMSYLSDVSASESPKLDSHSLELKTFCPNSLCMYLRIKWVWLLKGKKKKPLAIINLALWALGLGSQEARS